MSDDFNVRKFPQLLEGVQKRPRSQSEGSPLTMTGNDEDTTSKRMFKFIRRLSSTAISPTVEAGCKPHKPPTLHEVPSEEPNQ